MVGSREEMCLWKQSQKLKLDFPLGSTLLLPWTTTKYVPQFKPKTRTVEGYLLIWLYIC